jgi:hypothetical protein
LPESPGAEFDRAPITEVDVQPLPGAVQRYPQSSRRQRVRNEYPPTAPLSFYGTTTSLPAARPASISGVCFCSLVESVDSVNRHHRPDRRRPRRGTLAAPRSAGRSRRPRRHGLTPR